jgi:arylsulfatase A-like enzyme
LDGVNLLPYLKGEMNSAPHDALYWRLGKQMALRQGDWKIVRYDTAAEGGTAGEISPLKLYHLADDTGEARDLASEHPEKVQKLETLWQAWNAQLARPLW